MTRYNILLFELAVSLLLICEILADYRTSFFVKF